MSPLASGGVAADLARAGLAANRARTLTAVAGMAVALTLVAAAPAAGRYEGDTATTGVLLAAVVIAATVVAVDRSQLRAAAIVHLAGARRSQRRMVVAAEAEMIGLAALAPALVVAVVVALTTGLAAAAIGGTLATATLVPAAIGLCAGKVRRTVTVLDAGAPPRSGRRRPLALRLVRLAAGVVIIVLAVNSGKHITDFFYLDLVLWPLLVMAGIGLLLAVPVLIDGAAALLRNLPGDAAPLAGVMLAERRRMVAPAAAVGAVAALIVTVNAVLGLGLAQREEGRRAILAGYSFTSGLAANQVTVAPEVPVAEIFGNPQPLVGDLVPAGTAGKIQRAIPGARAAGVIDLPVDVRSNPLVPNDASAALATPELLATLGLERYAGDLRAGRAVALDPTVLGRDGQVRLEAQSVVKTLPDGSEEIDLSPPPIVQPVPAVVVQTHRVPVELPSVLVPRAVADRWWRQQDLNPAVAARQADRLVVSLPAAARPADVRRIGALLPPAIEPAPTGNSVTVQSQMHQTGPVVVAGGSFAVATGQLGPLTPTISDSRVPGSTSIHGYDLTTGDARPLDPRRHDRLDASGMVSVHNRGDMRVQVALTAIGALLALATVLRLAALTSRAEEDLFEVIGAPTRTLRRMAGWQAGVLAVLAVPAGVAAGVLAVRPGIRSYNATGRVFDGGALPPIPFSVPTALVVVAVAVPVLAVIGAWVAAGRRPPVEPAGLADRLAW